MHPLIEQLNLQPHPEGGYFAEVYRATETVTSPFNQHDRPTLTHIYFLLLKGQRSRFHLVAHDEVWNHYCGAPLRLLHIKNETELNASLTCSSQEIILGTSPHFAHVINANQWQAAESTGDYTLVGCSVAPGFDFQDFRFMREPQETEWVTQHKPEWQAFI